MSKEDRVLQELEEALYNPQVLKKIERKLQLKIDEPKKAFNLLKKNHFSLAKEQLSGSHYSIIADFSGQGFWNKRYVSQIKKNPGTIILSSKPSQDMKKILNENEGFSRKLVLNKIKKWFGPESDSYKILVSWEHGFDLWYNIIRSIEESVFRDEIRQPTVLVSSSFVWKALAGGMGKDPRENWKVLEAICKDFLVNIVYFNESPTFSPWMEYIGSIRELQGVKNENLLEYYTQSFLNPKNVNKKISMTDAQKESLIIDHKVRKIKNNFQNFYEIPESNYKSIWSIPSAKIAVLKSDECNEFLESLFLNDLIEEKDFVNNLRADQDLKNKKTFFTALENNPKRDYTSNLPKDKLAVAAKTLFYTKNNKFFDRCLRDSYYQEKKSSKENASLINHLLVSEQWVKLEILGKYDLLNSKITDEEGHSPEMVLDLLKKRSLKNFKFDKKIKLADLVNKMANLNSKKSEESFDRIGA